MICEEEFDKLKQDIAMLKQQINQLEKQVYNPCRIYWPHDNGSGNYTAPITVITSNNADDSPGGTD
jgi:hypothetical protein